MSSAWICRKFIGAENSGGGGMIFDPRFSWRHPYGWRTKLRILLPLLMGARFFDKGEDCESRGAQHYWYNHDDENSGCYYCKVVRPGQLWKN